MNIIKLNLVFTSNPQKRKSTKRIILHHAAAVHCTITDIHQWHLSRGFAGVGYHFVIYKDGAVYQGRPIDTIGAHASGHNNDSIGICFVGDFTKEKISDVQLASGNELLDYLYQTYNLSNKDVLGHKDVGTTACPGTESNFPLDKFKAYSGTVNVPDTIRTIRKGSKGSDVKYLQEQLNANGANLVVDGDFGNKTASATITYQKENKLTPDAIVGPKTWGSLLGSK